MNGLLSSVQFRYDRLIYINARSNIDVRQFNLSHGKIQLGCDIFVDHRVLYKFTPLWVVLRKRGR